MYWRMIALSLSHRSVGCACLTRRKGPFLLRGHSLFSSYSRQPSGTYVEIKLLTSGNDSDWPDTRLGGLAPVTRRFPLPGLVGSDSNRSESKTRKPKTGHESDLFTAELSHERQSNVIEQFSILNQPAPNTDPTLIRGADKFDFTATECPQLLKEDIVYLFPSQNNYSSRNVTVILISSKESLAIRSTMRIDNSDGIKDCLEMDAKSAREGYDDNYAETLAAIAKLGNSQSSNSSSIFTSSRLGQSEINSDLIKSDKNFRENFSDFHNCDEDIASSRKQDEEGMEATRAYKASCNEKISVVENFIEVANDLCELLHSSGHWADFVDPTSGQPYIGNQLVGSGTYEVEERYRRLGFAISNYGSCKVLSHHPRGSTHYIGCLFTSAPVSHPIIKNLVQSI